MEEAGKQVFCMELVPRTSPLIAVGESNSEQSSAALLTGFWVSNIYSKHKPLIALACEGIKLLPLGPGLTQTLISKEISRKMSQERQHFCMCHVNLVLYQYSTVYLRRPYFLTAMRNYIVIREWRWCTKRFCRSTAWEAVTEIAQTGGTYKTHVQVWPVPRYLQRQPRFFLGTALQATEGFSIRSNLYFTCLGF